MTRTIAGHKNSTWQDRSSYVQINIYNTNLKDLRQHGINIKNMLKRIERHSVVLDVPIPSASSRRITTLSSRRREKPLREQQIQPEAIQAFKVDKPALKVNSVADSTISSVKGAKRGNLKQHTNVEIFQDCLEEACENSYSEDICDRQLQPKLHSNEALRTAKPTNCEKRVLQRESPHISHFQLSRPQPSSVSQKFSEKPRVHPGKREISSILPGTVSILEHNNARCTKESVNQPELSTPYSLGKHGMTEIDVSKLLGSESTVKESTYKGANTSERKDEKGVSEEITCTPADKIMRKSMSAKNITGQKASKRIENMTASPSADTEGEYVGSTPMKATNTRKRKSLSSSNENRAEKKDGEGNVLEPRGDAEDRKSSSIKAEERTKLFECQMKGCGQKIHWRPGYGKDRILNHVRTHWGKPTKKCKLCDFKATHAHKVLSHHKVAHSSENYGMADSLETKEDLEQLELLWRECFPAWFALQSSKPNLSTIF
ncbi:hypothetical protein Aduo_001015 [Ancylostoma duodenale]